MPLIPITEEEAIGSRAQTPVRFTPVDPLQDFAVYDALEDEKEARGYDPEDPGIASKIWNGVKSALGAIPAAMKAAQTIGRAAFPLHGIPVRKDQEAAGALAVQTAGKVVGNYQTLEKGVSTLVQKGINAGVAAVKPELEDEMKTLSRRAAWEFQREARATEEYTNRFNQHLEARFPEALRGLGSVPVDNNAAAGLAMFADPANLFPAAAGAGWTTRVPLRGAVRAANVAVKESALDVARAAAQLQSAKIAEKKAFAAFNPTVVHEAARAAEEALKKATQRHEEARKALSANVRSQAAVVDDLAIEAAQQPLVTRSAAVAARGAGRAIEAVGGGLQRLAAAPDKLSAMVAGGADDAAREGITQGVRNVSGLFGVLPAAAGTAGTVARSAGRNLSVYGRLLSEAEGQLPFFKDLARQTTGLASWSASLVDQSGLGTLIAPAARVGANASRGLPFAAAINYAGSGGDEETTIKGLGAGLVFGLAGAGYGQWQRYATGAVFRQRQLADVDRYRRTLPASEARTFFDNLPASDRAALATMQLAHPDLRIQYSRLGKDRPSFYYAAEDGPVAVVNLDTRESLPAVLAHEVGHHVERHGLGPAVERTLLGDPVLEQPGFFTKLDGDGKPVRTPEGAFQTNEEWARLRGVYEERLKALGDRAGEVVRPRTDAEIAREIFAEHAADYLLGRDGQLTRDLRADVWSRALGSLAGSEFVANVPTLRAALGKMGAALTPGEKRVLGSELFPGGTPASRDLQRLISRYHRESARGRAPKLDDEPGNTRYTAAEVQKHPQILEKLFDGTDDVKRDGRGRVMRDKSGAPIFHTPKEQAALRAELAKELVAKLEAAPPPGARVESVVNPKSGKAEEGWVTPAIPDPVLDELAQSGKFNPVQIEHLRRASAAITEGQGRSLLFFYQPALNGGKKYQSLSGDWRTETPYAIFVSKAGNVLLRTMSREKLMANVQELVAKKRAGLWDNNVAAVVTDVDRYLANHAAGRPGSDGIGNEKRDQINALFGIGTKTNRSANPLIESSPKAPVVIRSRRLDRTNRLSPVEEYFPTSYDKLNANLRPEGAASESAGVSRLFSEANRLTNLNKAGAAWKRIMEDNPGVDLGSQSVTVYRAAVGPDLRPDDFVALSRKVAEDHLEILKDRGERGKITAHKVRPDDLLMANDATEFVWFPQTVSKGFERGH